MKKSELRSLIRECVCNALKEASYKPDDDAFIEYWVRQELFSNGRTTGDAIVDKAIDNVKEEWKEAASRFPTVRGYLMDLRKQGVFDELLESTVNEANEMSFINKARAKSSLEQIKKGKRSDGMGKFDAKVYAIKGTQEIELTDPSDLAKYSVGYKYGLKSESKLTEIRNLVREQIKAVLKEDTSIIDKLIASGDLTAPTGTGYGMQKTHYILKNGSDSLMFKYNDASSKPFEVARVFGSFLDKKLLNSLGFEEKFSSTASKNLFEPPNNGSESVNLAVKEFELLLADFKQGFKAYAKSFADFYKDRRPD